jgi:diguanylate cyclase (GGDEF)-like protein/putative nucleotidyltransferase with HDIG domain
VPSPSAGGQKPDEKIVLARKPAPQAADGLQQLQQQLSAAQERIAELEQQLAAKAEIDPVTGLSGPNSFARTVELEVERCRRHGTSLSIAVLDIDGFRIVNSSHGRPTGDYVLRTFGQALAEHTRANDLVTRSGGDEFLLALPETDGAEAVQAFDRLMLELEALRVGPIETLSASVGIAQWARGMTLDDLIEKAGERMRAARAAGGGRVEANGDAGERSESSGHHDAVVGLAEALTERDRYTGEHSEEVLDLVEQVARGLALDEQEVSRIRYAALLHDIGKVAIPDEILHKPDKLTDEEFEVMKTHTIVGERILRAIPGLGGVARIVRSEHERFDGGGYPDGLKGEEIPIGARIILACDAYHAMVSDRPYRKAMDHREAIRELGKNAGSQFDPQVTEVLIGALYSKRQAGSTTAKPVAA